MKFLIDTNVFIPLEPTQSCEVDDRTLRTGELVRLLLTSGSQVYVHPAQRIDIARDNDVARRATHEAMFNKYPVLDDPPRIARQTADVIGHSAQGSNDWVDDMLLAALCSDAVNYLVSEDSGVHRKARKLGKQDRVLSVADAVMVARRLFDRVLPPPPAVVATRAHTLDSSDPIFGSFRQDYPEFDNWLVKAKNEHRLTWLIRAANSGLAAMCIVKPEISETCGLSGKVLKLCSFKVSDACSGYRYGELLLRAVFDHSVENHYDWLVVTVFMRHARTVDLFEDFGFHRQRSRTQLGELVLVKPMAAPRVRPNMAPLEYHIRYGPRAALVANVSAYVVPIQPRFHRLLFPDAERQQDMEAGLRAYGNSIRKAYLCNSVIRVIKPGSNLLFYRSTDIRAITTLGVVEDVLISKRASDIAPFVGKRTVYSYSQIQRMCGTSVLAILFRHARVLSSPISLQELKDHCILKAQPQSISSVPIAATAWVESRICA